MTIDQAIVGDHDLHRELLEGLAATSGETHERRTLWNCSLYDVKAHAAAEEEILYSKLIAIADGRRRDQSRAGLGAVPQPAFEYCSPGDAFEHTGRWCRHQTAADGE